MKVAWPHEEARTEVDALRVWDGDGTIRVLAHDAERWAMLLERCVPGTPLGDEWDDETVAIGIGFLRRLWRPVAGGFPVLHDLAISWAATGHERAERWPELLDAGIVREGLDLLVSLAESGQRLLLHTDLHPGNVLRSQREKWLAIDPKPVIGDPGYDAYQLIVDGVHDVDHLRARISRVAGDLGIEVARLQGWALARSVEWALWAGRNDPTIEYAIDRADRARLAARLS
ncbi:MAG: streptomycin 6-kinase [Actinomycetota bacterium]|jgi:streptomycin 6-kinase